MRVLVAGVGYSHMRDLSIGPALVPFLQALDWPAGIDVDDLSFGPIAVVQRFQDHPGWYQRVVFVAGVVRGRRPGQITVSRWEGDLPPDGEVQQRISEAVTGVISLDNLLVIAERFGVLPADVVVVEVEPADTGWGEGFSPQVEARWNEILKTVQEVALRGYCG